MKREAGILTKTISVALLGMAIVAAPAFAKQHPPAKSFNRIAVFPVFENSDIAYETVAEIVDVSKDGNTLIYTDSQLEVAGLIDITDPGNPKAAGTVALAGEPTSVAVAGGYALVAVNTSADFVNTSGELVVIEVTTKEVITTLPLGGQPDSVAVSPDGRYAAVVIENERDEDLGDGAPPQRPSGFLVIVDLMGDPTSWTTRNVGFDGVADMFPEDAEPEYVDINKANMAVVTFQESNHIAIVNLVSGKVVKDFPAGAVDLAEIDTLENDLIELNSSLTAVPREPDGVKAIPSRNLLVAASEEDSRDDGFRAVVNIYQLDEAAPSYPAVMSADRDDGTPIPWGALSGLAADPAHSNTVYTIHDSFYRESRVYAMDVSKSPAVITSETVLRDSMGKLAAIDPGMVNG
jgi:hypothetical protein